jgi:hypothetical protein
LIPKILCVIPCLPEDLNGKCVECVKNQTIPVSKLLVLSGRGSGVTLQERVSSVLNEALGQVDLNDYDYLLRVDSDTLLPETFLEDNLGLADVVGDGFAHLIRVLPFLAVMGGRFNLVSDDSYLNYKFMMQGYSWVRCHVEPHVVRPFGVCHGISYFLVRGRIMWACGFEPFHVLGAFLWDKRNVFAVFGYFASLLMCKSRLDVANFVFHRQSRRLIRGKIND